MNKQLSSSASIFIIAGVAILALVALGLAGKGGGLPGAGPRTGSVAPPLTGETPEGKQVSLDELKGKVVLINFWATWCNPCRQEMPVIEATYRKYKDRGLVVLAVACDETRGPVDAQLKGEPLPFTVVYGDAKMQETYAIRALPTTVLVDRTGKIAFDVEGYNPSLDFDKLVEQVL